MRRPSDTIRAQRRRVWNIVVQSDGAGAARRRDRSRVETGRPFCKTRNSTTAAGRGISPLLTAWRRRLVLVALEESSPRVQRWRFSGRLSPALLDQFTLAHSHSNPDQPERAAGGITPKCD